MFNYEHAKNIIDSIISKHDENASDCEKSFIHVEHSKNVKITISQNEKWVLILFSLFILIYPFIQKFF